MSSPHDIYMTYNWYRADVLALNALMNLKADSLYDGSSLQFPCSLPLPVPVPIACHERVFFDCGASLMDAERPSVCLRIYRPLLRMICIYNIYIIILYCLYLIISAPKPDLGLGSYTVGQSL